MIRIAISLLLLTIAFLLSCTPNTEGKVKVVRVIDGDTIEIQGGYHVRYIGIDTPEIYPQEEYYGIEALERNRELVGGKEVILEKDVTNKDQYGRLLRYIYVDGVLVNAELVKEGFARAIAYPPDILHQELFTRLEKEAKEVGRGLWHYNAQVE